MQKMKTLTTLEEIRTFSDPYRLKIMSTLKRLGRPATATEIAVEMGETPAKVHYHVKKLEAADIIKLDHTEEINGIIAKYYQPTAHAYHIKNADLDPAVSQAVLTEAEKLVKSLYRESETVVLQQLQYLDPNSEKTIDQFSLSEVHLSDEKAKELTELVEEFVETHGKKVEGSSEKRKYHWFSVLVPLEHGDKHK